MIICTAESSAQIKFFPKNEKIRYSDFPDAQYKLTDTLEKKRKGNISIGGIFFSAGFGFAFPVGGFSGNSDYAFGFLGRLEYASTSIFPLVIGGEISYADYGGSDEFKTLNILSNFDTKIISFGLSADYSLSKLIKTPYLIPFITADIKSNIITREYDSDVEFSNLPRNETGISISGGFGFTVFVFDIYAKYSYMKNFTTYGFFTKIKIPIIRF